MALQNEICVEEKRVNRHLDTIGNIGKNPKGGWTRLAFSPEEQTVHDYARGVFEKEGYNIRTDAFGNLVASKEGKDTSRKRVMLGTHLDTVINGGNYDGVVGFITAVEAVKAAELVRGQLEYGIDVVVFRAEESTRFKKACLGSSAAFGFLENDELKRRRYKDNGNYKTLEEAIIDNGGCPEKIGTGKMLIDATKYSAYIETHIEQSTVLEQEGIPIGIVTSIRAPERRKIEVKGNKSIKAAAEIIESVNLIATNYTDQDKNDCKEWMDIVATVGEVQGYFQGPDKINAVPGFVTFKINQFNDNLRENYNAFAFKHNVEYSIEKDGNGYEITINGRTDHSGGTPMGRNYRKDSLAAAADMILCTPDDFIPQEKEISLYVDIRSNNLTDRNAVNSMLFDNNLPIIREKYGVVINAFEPTESSLPQKLDTRLSAKMESSASELGLKYKKMPSGAGHDAMKAAQVGIPTIMLFVPSKDGISHSPKEFTDNKYIIDGTNVLTNCLMNL